MLRLIFLPVFLLIGISSFAQELELCGSFGTSSEIRLRDAFGIGLQYQKGISKKFKVGFGTHYYLNTAHFTERYPSYPATSRERWVTTFTSKSERIALRLNILELLRDNEYVTLAVGTEVSYNFLWGSEDLSTWQEGYPNGSSSYDFDLEKKIGIGVLSTVEIKKFLTPNLSLCLAFRPELMLKNRNPHGAIGYAKFWEILDFTEFQLGLKYKLNKPKI